MRDGAQVAYVGPDRDGLAYGERGQVLSCTAAYAHVRWLEGARRGDFGLYAADELEDVSALSNTVTASLDDSLEVGALASLASAQEVYEETGGEGLVGHLASAGHFAAYAPVAEEALQLIATSLRRDAMLERLTSAMDPEEADEVYRTAARNLISDLGDF